jgi:hypothetical protein
MRLACPPVRQSESPQTIQHRVALAPALTAMTSLNSEERLVFLAQSWVAEACRHLVSNDDPRSTRNNIHRNPLYSTSSDIISWEFCMWRVLIAAMIIRTSVEADSS